jgi:uncharacterized protein (TIGR02466 family)
MPGRLEQLFAKPVMVFNNLLPKEDFKQANNWLKQHFENNAVAPKVTENGAPLYPEKGHGMNKTTVTVSTHSWDPNLQNNPEFSTFNKAILDSCKEFADVMGYEKCSDYLFIKDMWAFIGKENTHIQQHLHGHSFISGAYYFEVPEGTKLIFRDYTNMHKVPDTFNAVNATQRAFITKQNQLVLFRSDIPHGTAPQPSGIDKLCVSFNVHFTPEAIFNTPGAKIGY